MKKLLPLILLLIGSGAGVGAGMFLRPPPVEPTEEEIAAQHEEAEAAAEAKAEEEHAASYEYVKMNNQFVVPIVSRQQVRSLVVLSLSIEVPVGQREPIYAREPKLRDSFLQILFDHANNGGFEGEFTNANNLKVLRNALREVAQKDTDGGITDVLIMEIARQDF